MEQVLLPGNEYYYLFQALKTVGELPVTPIAYDPASLHLDQIKKCLFNNPKYIWKVQRIYLQSAKEDRENQSFSFNDDDHSLVINCTNQQQAYFYFYWLTKLAAIAETIYKRANERHLPVQLLHYLENPDQRIQVEVLQALLFALDIPQAQVLMSPDENMIYVLQTCFWFACQLWQPKCFLHADLRRKTVAGSSNTGNYIGSALLEMGCESRPLHIVLNDTHGLIDLLSPYTREVRDVLVRWTLDNQHHVLGGDIVADILNQGLVNENTLYWITKDFLAMKTEISDEYIRANETCGIYHRSWHAFGDFGFQFIDLEKIEWDLVDPRLSMNKPTSGTILQLPLQYSAASVSALKILLDHWPGKIASVSMVSRYGSIGGAPALVLPRTWLWQANQSIMTVPLTNALGLQDLAGLIEQPIVENACLCTVVHSGCLDGLEQKQWADIYNCAGVDKIGAYVAHAISAMMLHNASSSNRIQWQAIMYPTVGALEQDSIRKGLSESELLQSVYASNVAVLRKIIPGHATPSQKKNKIPPLSTRMRLRA